MGRTLRIKWPGAEKINARLETASDSSDVGILLAHGAGAGQVHPFMQQLRRGLATGGLTVMTFDYAYAAAGRRAPDRLPKLLAVHEAAADRLATYVDRVVLAGKSMGGRVGSHLAGDHAWPAAGVVYYAYPLVPPGKSGPRPTDHLERITVPQLFLVGTRDRLSPLAAIRELASALPQASVHVIEGGDHSFRTPQSLGRDAADVMGELVTTTASWVEGLALPAKQPGGADS